MNIIAQILVISFAVTHTYLNNKKVIASYDTETGICSAMVFGSGADLSQGAGVMVY